MACITTRLSDGTTVWLRGDAFTDSDVCRVCGFLADALCDFPIGNDKTCDSALCSEHAKVIIGDIHYCPEHSGEYGNIKIF
jgi:hypothetical protein